jgi:proteasome lid subunit RPN8/RPN11
MTSHETPVGAVQIASGAWQDIHDHAKAALPEECCGLLVGHADGILEVWPARNVSPDPRRRFLVSPEDHFSAQRHVRTRGLGVVGVYHSHPAGSAQPSPTDCEEAAGEGFLYLIAAPAVSELRAWRVVRGNFHEVRLVPVT